MPDVALPLQLVDSFLLDYSVGQVLLLLFLLSLGVVAYSRRLFAINLTVFGLVFLLTPASLLPTQTTFLAVRVATVHYLFGGVLLVVLGPMVYVMSRE